MLSSGALVFHLEPTYSADLSQLNIGSSEYDNIVVSIRIVSVY